MSRVLSTAQVAEELGLSGARVRQMLAAGELAGYKVGRAWVITRLAVQELKKQRAQLAKSKLKELDRDK